MWSPDIYAGAAQLVLDWVVYMIVYGCMHLKELMALFHKSRESRGAMIALSLLLTCTYILVHTYTLVCQ